MSTRATIIVTDRYASLYFYRHSDGYPEGVEESLGRFCEMIKSGKIRNNINQAAGWLVVIGREEYLKGGYLSEDAGMAWKVGAYEPTNVVDGFVEHVYTVDVRTGTYVHETINEYEDRQSNKLRALDHGVFQ